MSEQVQAEQTVEQTVEQKPADQQPQPPTHAEMFFRYVSALAQTAGVQAYTMSVAVPKADGTSGIMAHSSIIPDGHPKWKNEVAKLLVTNALQASMNLMTPEERESGSLPYSNASTAKADEVAQA